MAENPLVTHFIALVEGWNAAGWGEYLLWEVLEGKRGRPFPFLDPLDPTDLQMLVSLRDGLQVWPCWNGISWELAGTAEWREHAAATSAKGIRDAMGGT